ncbi:uncharacterized protein V1510DRAFT_368353 [Dipodascopsis tothii]|uniref:uncharacterized protein n=1 Tax=Dipodascopsis tothii TaxID=44089 RepID=UPI0034CE9541
MLDAVESPAVGAHALDEQLEALHARAHEYDADVLFIMPNGGEERAPGERPRSGLLPGALWAHSELLALASGKPLDRVGEVHASDAAGAVVPAVAPTTAAGAPYTVVLVAAEHDLAVRKLVAGCYKPVVVRSLWERMRGPANTLAALDDTLAEDARPRPAVPGGVVLQIEGEPAGFVVHKYLLDLRVPYFATLFRSAFRDADSQVHVLSADYFSPLSLAIVVQFLYLDDADLLFLWKWTDFKRYLAADKCSAYINPPTQEILDVFVDTLVSAKFLQLEGLERWVVRCLRQIAHGFACTGPNCARLLPRIAILAHQNSIPELYEPTIAWLARHPNILLLWKRSLLELPDDAGADLVAEVKRRIQISNAVLLYLRLFNLKKNIEASAFKLDWEERFISPLLDHCAHYVSFYLADPHVVFAAVRGLNQKPPTVSYQAMDSLFTAVLAKLCRQNAAVAWRGAECYHKLAPAAPIVDTFTSGLAAWFAANWAVLLPGGAARAPPTPVPGLDVPPEDFVVELDQWPDDSLAKLAAQTGVPVWQLQNLPADPGPRADRDSDWHKIIHQAEISRLNRKSNMGFF